MLEYKENEDNLCVCCVHIKNKNRKFQFRGNDVMCNECWKMFDLLNWQFRGNIPADDFMHVMGKYILTSCKECVMELTGGV